MANQRPPRRRCKQCGKQGTSEVPISNTGLCLLCAAANMTAQQFAGTRPARRELSAEVAKAIDAHLARLRRQIAAQRKSHPGQAVPSPAPDPAPAGRQAPDGPDRDTVHRALNMRRSTLAD